MVTVDQGSTRYPSLQIVADEPLRLAVTDEPSTPVVLLTHRSLTRQDVVVLWVPQRARATGRRQAVRAPGAGREDRTCGFEWG